jgi:hypothetical protein
MYKMAGLVLLALAALLSLPYLLYWLLWLVTGRGLPPKQMEQPGYERGSLRPQEIWALKTVGATSIAVGIYRAAMFLWVR